MYFPLLPTFGTVSFPFATLLLNLLVHIVTLIPHKKKKKQKQKKGSMLQCVLRYA